MRLNKFLSDSGVCSRREADRQIENGKVFINNEVAVLGAQVAPEDEVVYCGKIVQRSVKKTVIALYKPVGIECTSNLEVKNNIISFLNYPTRVFPVGRLDKNSEGLILLTDDGELANRILKARNFHEKEYIVTVDKVLSAAFLSKMSKGVEILDTMTRPCKVEKKGDRTFDIILTQGLNRQIRRMCEALNYEVVRLKRIRILNIQLGELKSGEWRLIEDGELETLRNLVYADVDEFNLTQI